jgi:uncharacterized protein (DUF885 family)
MPRMTTLAALLLPLSLLACTQTPAADTPAEARAGAPATLATAGDPHDAGAAPSAASFAAAQAFRDLFVRWIGERAALDPGWATRVGRHEHDGRLTRFGDAEWQARAALASRTLAAVEALDVAALPPGDAIDWRLFRAQLRVEAHEYGRRDLRTLAPGLALDGVTAVNDLLIRDFAPLPQRVRDAAARLAQLPGVCAELLATLRAPPRVWTEMAIEDTGGALAFLQSVPGMAAGATSADPALAVALAQGLDAARAGLTAYRDRLRTEVLPRSTGEFAIGREEYDWLLREGWLLDLDAEALLALGQKQFDVTLALLEETARAIAPGRDWRALLAEMMAQHPTAAGLMGTYRDEVARARQYLLDHRIVGIPDEVLQIRETPPFMRSTVPFAAYDAPAPLDASRLGTFFVTPDPEAHILADIPGTVWHEAYPGHHLQLVYAKDNPSLVRRLNDSPLLSEGWGFYCEELAHEAGYYDDPRERLMQLNWRLQRAARVILDVSLQTGEMGWAQAVDFLVRAVGMGRPQAEASVNAYTRQPTYFSSYMLGMLEIVRLREESRARLGERFTLQEFHERLLRAGNVPPALVEAELLATWR